MPAPPLSPDRIADILRVYAECGSFEQAANRLGLSRGTVSKYVRRAECGTLTPQPASAPIRLPDPAPEAGGPGLPEPIPLSHDPVQVDTQGPWLVFGDTHLPYHDRRTIELAVEEGRKRGAVGVLVNGDMLDSWQLSRHYREPSKERFADGCEAGKQFLAWLRSRFPAARILWKFGNHDEYLRRYLAERAPEVFGLDGFNLESVVKVADYGVEVVQDKRAIHLGRLPVFHGHEFRGGGGVNPARWLFLRIISTGMVSHFHRTSEHHEASYDNRLHGVWSLGCACFLQPQYDPFTKWNHGWAIVTVGTNGTFEVTNRRVLKNGQVV